ncbi:putative meiotic recombination protein Ski8/Rec14 [Diaporthe sp. PMI_573]|nr:putative meiotic recombination protein Ski8/Rec14 [Diaporthaceae sp. PMI_573]
MAGAMLPTRAASSLFPRLPSSSVFSSPYRFTSLNTRQISFPFLPRYSLAIPTISLNLPSIPGVLEGIWEGILKAVPKKKTSHAKKRHRQMAGKALKDVNNLCKCPVCGGTKRMHHLCETCMNTHTTDVFSLAATPTVLFSASGSPTINLHRINDPSGTFPISQSLSAHKLGCHHVATAPRGSNGTVAASVGFGGDIKIWRSNPDTGDFSLDYEITPPEAKTKGVSDSWAVALSSDENYIACTTHDGKVHVWDLRSKTVVQTYETGGSGNGSFGLSVGLSPDGRLTASGHQNGSVYVFNNDAGHLKYSLSGLAKPVRAVAFSPGNTRLAAAGDAGIIAIYDVTTGEHVGILNSGGSSSAWITSLDWSDTGEFLLSGSTDGKVRVWSIDRGVCVATHSETDKILWSVRWLPKAAAHRGEMFCTAGANRSLTFYREGGKV